jgi:uncharacterized protein (UPF0332 family)
MNKKSLQVAHKELARAKKSLLAAETLLEHELNEDAVSRAYYAVLHAAKAALATIDLFPDSHQSVRRMFGLHLVKTNLIEREYATILTAEQEDRELSDYDIDISIEKDRADRRVDDAGKFVERIERHLHSFEPESKHRMK